MTGAPRLEIGRIGRAHGLRGEVSFNLVSERDERLAPGTTLYRDGEPIVVATSRRHQQRWLVRFEGIEDRTAAEALHGVTLSADALPTEGDELWVHELIGATVLDPQGARLGTVEAIEANPASDLLVLDGERLIPLRFVTDHAPGQVTVDVPDGLLD